MYLVDPNVHIRGFRELTFGRELQELHRRELGRRVVGAVVASEGLVGAQSPGRERAVHRTLVQPFRARRRFVDPGWTTWTLATAISIDISVGLGAVGGALFATVGHGLPIGLVWELVLLLPLGLCRWSLQGTTWLLRLLRGGIALARKPLDPVVGGGAG